MPPFSIELHWRLPSVIRVGVRGLSADVLGAAIEQGPGNLGGRAARLDRAVVNWARSRLPLRLTAGVAVELPMRGLERPVVVQAAVDPGEVAGDQPRQPGRRIDLRERESGSPSPRSRYSTPEAINLPVMGTSIGVQVGAGAGVDEGGDSFDVQSRILQERLNRIADEIQIIGRSMPPQPVPGLYPLTCGFAVRTAVDRGPCGGLKRQVALGIVERRPPGNGHLGGWWRRRGSARCHCCNLSPPKPPR